MSPPFSPSDRGSVRRDLQHLVPVLGRVHPCPLLYKPAEVGDGREVHASRDFSQGKSFMAEQTDDLLEGEAIYPIGRRLAARFLAYLRQVVRCDIES